MGNLSSSVSISSGLTSGSTSVGPGRSASAAGTLDHPIRVLIADDDAQIRALLETLLRNDPRMVCVAAARDADEAVDLARGVTPDVAVLDCVMPSGGGPAAARGILSCSPGTIVIAYSGSDDRAALIEMLQAGARGYIVKGGAIDELLDGISGAAEGQFILSGRAVPTVVEELLERLSMEEREATERRVATERIARFIAGKGLDIVFQPVFRLQDRQRTGMEALSRMNVNPRRPPNEWFAEAWDVGLGVELELAAAKLAIRERGDRGGEYLAVNLSPETVLSPRFDELLGQDTKNLVVEVTEHAPVLDYQAFRVPIARLREGGGILAIDDVGAGFSSLHHILELDPDVIKLDVGLTSGIEVDPKRQSIAAGLISMAADSGTAVIAEGIETESQLVALADLGVEYGQGYHLGRPLPLTALLDGPSVLTPAPISD